MLPFDLPEVVSLSQEVLVSMGATGLVVAGLLNFFLPLVFPFPPLLVMIPLVAAAPELALVFVVAATLGELAAGVVGWAVGKKGGRPVLESRISESRFERVDAYFERNGFATVTIGSFAPIPEAYEVLSLGSGAFGMSLRRFVLASLIGRGAKYLLAAGLIIAAGDAASALSQGEIYTVVGVVTLVVLAGYLARRRWRPDWGVGPS